jgi:hypothetical protein
MAFAQDPKLQELMQQNPNAQTMMAAGAAHIAEHIAFLYRKQIEEQLGVALPPEDQQLPEEVEVSLSRLVAQASSQLQQKNQAEAAQEQQAQEEQDPLNIIQREELNLRKQELEIKAQKEMATIELDKAKFELEKAKLIVEAGKTEEESRRKDKDLEVKQLIEGAKMGMQAVQSGDRNSFDREKYNTDVQFRQSTQEKQAAKPPKKEK